MYIKKKLLCIQQGMALLENGEPKEIGGVTHPMDLELADGTLTNVYCVFFNLDSNVKSTDFFLFSVDNRQLVTHSFGRKTDSFFRKLYQKALSNSELTTMDLFLEEFIGDYIVGNHIIGDSAVCNLIGSDRICHKITG